MKIRVSLDVYVKIRNSHTHTRLRNPSIRTMSKVQNRLTVKYFQTLAFPYFLRHSS